MHNLLLITTLFAAGGNSPVDFDNDVMPVFTKAGCNTGACHGAAIGRGGFKLSLYGSDPAADYRAIVQELEGRRINLARPPQSLLILKPTAQMNHGGDERFVSDSKPARLLEAWIRAGAPRVSGQKLQQIQITPQRVVVEQLQQSVPLKVTAFYDDRSSRDVTAWSALQADDPAAVAIDEESATARLMRRGRHILTARYADRIVPMEILVPLSEEPVDLSRVPGRNFIDEEILQRLETLRIPASPPCDDSTFLRRLTLDLTGRLPVPERVRAFLDDRRSDKRDRLTEELLRSDEFTEFWTYQFAKLLRIRSQPKDTTGALTYHNWLKEQIEKGRPFQALARELVTASGDSHEFGPANFYRTTGDARSQAEFVSEVFLGVRLRCANCHNHPLDKWTQDDYHGFAAIFAKIDRGRVVKVGSRGEVTHPRTGQAAVPRIPGERFLPADADNRAAFADWLTSPENPYFAKAVVNRLWKAIMGRGLVEPTDDLRDTNPATHPRLLDRLAEEFVERDYDLRAMLRLIARSSAYQRSVVPLAGNRGDDRFYSHALTRPLEPEVLADAIADVTGVAEQYGEQPEGTRAVALFDSNIKSESLDILGRCSREESCETPMGASGGLSTKLHLLNGGLINRKITSAAGRLPELLAAGKTDEEIVEAFYLRALGRFPTAEENDFWHRQFAENNADSQRKEILEDFLWSLLSCREFVTNH